MKRKFVSAMLFGAMLIAPAITFVGCSDYDDDISGLNTSTSELKTQLDNQVTALNDLKTNLESEISKAKAEAEAASTKAQKAAEDAKSAADAAAQQAANALAQAAAAEQQAALATQAAAQAKLDAVNESKAACEAMINSINAATKDDVNELKTRISAIENDLSKIDAGQIDVNKQAIEQLKIQMAAVEAYKALIEANSSAIANAASKGEVEGLKTQLNQLSTSINDKISKLASAETTTGMQTQLNTIGNQVNKIQGNLNTLLTSKLKSLVFRPDFYYQGIEAMDAGTFNYDILLTNNVNADDDFSTDAPQRPVSPAATTMSMTPDLTATYHLNPSNAEIDTKDASKYKFVVLNRDYVRASEQHIEPSIYKATANKADGTVSVKAHFANNTNLIKDINNDGEVTVMALQYQQKDTVVTSDYAAVKATNYNNLKLNLAESNVAGIAGSHIHLYGTAAAAIANDPQLQIEYNGTLNIDKYINTHRSIVNGMSDIKWDNNAASGTVEKSGFKYSYQLVGYHSGSNKTSETAHLAIKDHTLRAQMPKDGKQQAYGAEQARAEINRMPLVRVVLTDTINNKIAAVGYVKLVIVDKIVTPSTKITETSALKITDAYTVQCTGNEISKQFSWYEIEENVIAKLGITKDEFDRNWSLLKYSGGNNAQQYKDAIAQTTAMPSSEAVGTITEIINAGSHQTSVLKWTISQNEAYQLAKQGKKSVTVYIRFKSTSGALVTIPFTYEPSAQNWQPTGAIKDSKKISNYWYSKNGSTAGSGYNDIHGNVEVVGQNGADDEYVFDIKNTLVGNKIDKNDLNLNSVYATVNNAATVKFVFIKPEVFTNVPGHSGDKYTLGVSSDGTKFTATKNLVTKTVATITSDGIVTFEKNDYAEDLLNNADHSALGDRESLTGRVKIIAATCDPAGDIALTGNEFNVKFLRPITIKNGEAKNLVDAATGGSEAAVSFTFTDWREHNFNNNSVTGGYNYYSYYGVSSIVAKDGYETGTYTKANNGITTTLNNGTLGTTLLKNITDKIKIEYIAPATTAAGLQNAFKAGNFGKVRYENNGLTVGDFKVRIPVKVTYDWGTINTQIDVTIGKTVHNVRPRH